MSPAARCLTDRAITAKGFEVLQIQSCAVERCNHTAKYKKMDVILDRVVLPALITAAGKAGEEGWLGCTLPQGTSRMPQNGTQKGRGLAHLRTFALCSCLLHSVGPHLCLDSSICKVKQTLAFPEFPEPRFTAPLRTTAACWGHSSIRTRHVPNLAAPHRQERPLCMILCTFQVLIILLNHCCKTERPKKAFFVGHVLLSLAGAALLMFP